MKTTLSKEQQWALKLGDDEPEKVQKAAIAHFRKYKYPPKEVLWIAQEPTLKICHLNALKVLEKWLEEDEDLVLNFIGRMSDGSAPGGGYCFEALMNHCVELLPILEESYENCIHEVADELQRLLIEAKKRRLASHGLKERKLKLTKEEHWAVKLSASRPEKEQKAAIAHFRKYAKAPTMAMAIIYSPAFKALWENSLRVLEKWLEKDELIVGEFLECMSDRNWPGRDYAYKTLMAHSKAILPKLEQWYKYKTFPKVREDITAIIAHAKSE